MEIKLKSWFYDKTEDTAKVYNVFIDYTRRNPDLGTRYEEDGCVFVNVEEVLGESEKAMKVRLSSGAIDGSVKGWTTWIPKSVFTIVED